MTIHTQRIDAAPIVLLYLLISPSKIYFENRAIDNQLHLIIFACLSLLALMSLTCPLSGHSILKSYFGKKHHCSDGQSMMCWNDNRIVACLENEQPYEEA